MRRRVCSCAVLCLSCQWYWQWEVEGRSCACNVSRLRVVVREGPVLVEHDCPPPLRPHSLRQAASPRKVRAISHNLACERTDWLRMAGHVHARLWLVAQQVVLAEVPPSLPCTFAGERLGTRTAAALHSGQKASSALAAALAWAQPLSSRGASRAQSEWCARAPPSRLGRPAAGVCARCLRPLQMKDQAESTPARRDG